MSLTKKYLKAFSAGFLAGVQSTTPYYNGRAQETMDPENFDALFDSDLKKALELFLEYLEKNNGRIG